MKPNQPYCDWKKELQVWKATNAAFTVNEKIQAGILFESLSGAPRQVVLSELTVDEIISREGVKNIIDTLDHFLMGNKTQNAFTYLDDLMNYKCKYDTTVANFITEFQLKVNKVKSSGTVLSDDLLGYILLNAANLTDDKLDMVKATCEEMSYKCVKAQLEKIGFRRSNRKRPNAHGKQEGISSKVEGLSRAQNLRNGSSETHSEDSNNRFWNPCKKLGNVSTCTYCNCMYHWLVDCPYSSNSIKGKRRKYNSSNQYLKNITLFTDLDADQLCILVGEVLGQAVVDTGCPRTVSGEMWLHSHINTLSHKDRSSIRTRDSHHKFRFQNGKSYPSLYHTIIPVYINNSRYEIGVDVIGCEVPLLLSRDTLRRAKAEIDVGAATIYFMGVTVPLNISSTGHMCLPTKRSLDLSNGETRKAISRVLFSTPMFGVDTDLKSKARKLHLQFCHPNSDRLVDLLKKAGEANQQVFDAIKEITAICDVCMRSRKLRTQANTIFGQGDKVLYRSNNQSDYHGPGVVIGQDGQQVLIKHGGSYIRVHPCRLQHFNEKSIMTEVSRKPCKTSSVTKEHHLHDSSSSDEENYNINNESQVVDSITENVVERPSQTEHITEETPDISDNRWVTVISKADLPKVNTVIDCHFPNQDDTIKCKILSKAGKSSTASWHYLNVQEDDKPGKCCSFKGVRWKETDDRSGEDDYHDVFFYSCF